MNMKLKALLIISGVVASVAVTHTTAFADTTGPTMQTPSGGMQLPSDSIPTPNATVNTNTPTGNDLNSNTSGNMNAPANTSPDTMPSTPAASGMSPNTTDNVMSPNAGTTNTMQQPGDVNATNPDGIVPDTPSGDDDY